MLKLGLVCAVFLFLGQTQPIDVGELLRVVRSADWVERAQAVRQLADAPQLLQRAASREVVPSGTD